MLSLSLKKLEGGISLWEVVLKYRVFCVVGFALYCCVWCCGLIWYLDWTVTWRVIFDTNIMEPEASNAQTMDNNAINLILARPETMSRDVARLNVGLEKLDTDVASMSGRLEHVESQRSWPSTPQNISPTNTPETLHQMQYTPIAINQTNLYSRSREQDRPSHPPFHQVQQEGLGTQIPSPNPNPPIQTLLDQRPHYPNLIPPLQAPLNPNKPIHVEGYGRGGQHDGYGPYDDVYLREERMRRRHGDLGREVRDGHPNWDVGLNSIKVSLPVFKGESDPEAYLAWESSCEKIFQLNDLTEEKKVVML